MARVDRRLEGVEEVVLQVHQEVVVVEVALSSLVMVEVVEHQVYLGLVVEVGGGGAPGTPDNGGGGGAPGTPGGGGGTGT